MIYLHASLQALNSLEYARNLRLFSLCFIFKSHELISILPETLSFIEVKPHSSTLMAIPAIDVTGVKKGGKR